jgi:N-acetylmuramoyl-L-alanine amidase
MKIFSILFFTISVMTITAIYEKYHIQRIVVIDPSGDAKRTGRRIGDSFERGLTLQCAEKIKEFIEENAPHIKVMITRMPGDIVYDLQNASLANRLQADFFINLNFYHAQETKPTMFLYQFSYGNDFASCQQGLALHTYDQAYRVNKSKTDEMCGLFKQSLSQQHYQSLFTLAGVYNVPVKPLIGIVVPSVAIEAGLKNKEMWISYVEPIARAIIEVME